MSARNGYGDGYQDACQEILDMYETYGHEAALAYMRAVIRAEQGTVSK
jgi:hypothetical protein